MLSHSWSRRAGALAIALATAVVAGLAAASTTELQPVAIPVVFGVALATAIDPRLWLVHLVLAGVGLAGFAVVDPAATVDFGMVASALVPAFIGAAMVRLACR